MSKKAPTTGRPSIFRGKDRTSPVNAYMTPRGKKKVHEARKRLAALVGWQIGDVKDGDVVEALARGWDETRAYLRQTGQIQ